MSMSLRHMLRSRDVKAMHEARGPMLTSFIQRERLRVAKAVHDARGPMSMSLRHMLRSRDVKAMHEARGTMLTSFIQRERLREVKAVHNVRGPMSTSSSHIERLRSAKPEHDASGPMSTTWGQFSNLKDAKAKHSDKQLMSETPLFPTPSDVRWRHARRARMSTNPRHSPNSRACSATHALSGRKLSMSSAKFSLSARAGRWCPGDAGGSRWLPRTGVAAGGTTMPATSGTVPSPPCASRCAATRGRRPLRRGTRGTSPTPTTAPRDAAPHPASRAAAHWSGRRCAQW